MIDLILDFIAQVILIIAGSILYVFLTSRLLPAKLLKPKNKILYSSSIGIKKYVFDNGRGIVYIPDPHSQKYLTQYVLTENSGEKFLTCQFDNRVITAEYKVTVFDCDNKVIDVITVHDTPDQSEISGAVHLPFLTSYVDISVISINCSNVSAKMDVSISPSACVLYAVLNFVVTFAFFLLVHVATTNIVNYIFDFDQAISGYSIIFVLASSPIFSVIYTLLTINKNLT
ncbi:MAG: hypothetical protein E7312_06755 [Clostridiales bacterium]|nr:hypothetical protein [Clostridiales bacterium]